MTERTLFWQQPGGKDGGKIPNALKLNWDEIQSRAIKFSKEWEGAGREISQSRDWVRAFLQVFGIHKLVGEFEKPVQTRDRHNNRIDFYWSTYIAIEMKSRGKNLREAYDQLASYMNNLPEEEEIPNLWMVSDFATILLYRHDTDQFIEFRTDKLRKHVKHFAELAGYEAEPIRGYKEAVNVLAAQKMARLHEALKATGYGGHALEVFLARILFCLFANDTNIFNQDSFQTYIEDSGSSGGDLFERIDRLFQDLDEPTECRLENRYFSEHVNTNCFKYINGGLFSGRLRHGAFDKKMRQTLLDCLKFDWSQISPAIFGSMFQGVMDDEQRREIGAHYTSEENILKLINPLFMDDLRNEFNKAKTDTVLLNKLHVKIAGLKFLDPACGCGNFLIIAYRELRCLELDIVKELIRKGEGRFKFNVNHVMKVKPSQFYGIEIEAWPCQIAQTGMWLMDHLMNMKASDELGEYFERLPLEQGSTIVNGNALRMDWEDVVPKDELSYILGNPPFVGKKEQSKEQKAELLEVFNSQKGAGNLDYVTAWYKKAVNMVVGKPIQAAFVSTNSISQGEQPSVLWKTLMGCVKIDFAYRTFKWSNEAPGRAAVHCVIIGFSSHSTKAQKRIFDGGSLSAAQNISPYLLDAPSVLIESRTAPLSAAPDMMYGSMPIDNGALILSQADMEELSKTEPMSKKFVRRYIGGEELINNTVRYCLWLSGVSPNGIKASKYIAERVKRCRAFREKSGRPQTKALADTPQLFGEIRQPETDMLVFPKISSENRKYLPIAFLPPEIIVNGCALIIPNASLYHFGILSSSVHMAWMRAVCGRLEMRYIYSKKIVYNNFPWPEATEKQKAKIEELAQGVLDSRAIYIEASLADLYDPLTMPKDLLKAHQALDRAVIQLYGFRTDMTEPEIVAELMTLYQDLCKLEPK